MENILNGLNHGLNGTVHAAKNAVDAARESAEHAVGAARESAEHAVDSARAGTEHAVKTTRSAFFDGIHAVTGLIATLRSLDGDDALGWVGLARRRSPFSSIALFGAGIAVGAGLGMMLAPTSGAELRNRIFGQIRGMKDEAKESLSQMGEEVQEKAKTVEQKAADLADKGVTALKQAERKVENKVTAQAEAVRDAVAGAASDLSDNVQAATQKGKTASHASHNGNGNRQPS